MANVSTPGWGEPRGRQGGITQWVARSNEVPQVPLHQPGTHCFSLPTACSQPPRCPWVAGGWGTGPCIGAGSAGKLPGASLSQQAKAKLLPQGPALPVREGLPSSTLAFKGNKPPVGAGGAESHSEEGAGLPASHDCEEEWGRGLPCPWEAQIPRQAGAGGMSS